MSTSIAMIAAAGEDNAIGKGNALPWRLPDDFRHFKQKTVGHSLIMGRKTFESLPDGPLPFRQNIIVTRRGFSAPFANCQVVPSFEEALAAAAQETKAFVIGGGEIYRLGLPYADTIELTRIHARFPGADTFFPELPENEWELISKAFHDKDAKHAHAFSFLTFRRKKEARKH